MKKCKNAKDYKAIYPPSCDKGKGCDVCRKIWQDRCNHSAMDLMVISAADAFPDDTKIGCSRCRKDVTTELWGSNPFLLKKFVELAQIVSNMQEDMGYFESSLGELSGDITSLEYRVD